MAGDAVIGALRAVLGIDTAGFETGLKSASSALVNFGVNTAKAAAAFGAAMTTAAGLISAGVQATINDMDTLGKSSKKLGIPVEQLSGLAYAADLADISFDQLTKSVGKLSKGMFESLNKPTGKAANAFKALKINVTDVGGMLKSTDVIMAELADRFKGMDDGALKAATAMQLFGKAGLDMIPLLNEGGAKIREMYEEARQFGVIVSGPAAEQADAFNDNITKLGYAFKGVFVQIATQILPTLVELSGKLVDTAKNSGTLKSIVEGSVKAFNAIRIAIQFTIDNFDTLLKFATLFVAARIAQTAVAVGLAFVAFAQAINLASIAMGVFNVVRKAGMAGIVIMVTLIAAAAGQLDNLTAKIKNMGKTIKEAFPDDLGDTFADLLEKFGFNISALKSELEKMKGKNDEAAGSQSRYNAALMQGVEATKSYLDNQNKSNAAKRHELSLNGLSAYSQAYLKTQYDATAAALGHGSEAAKKLAAEIHKTSSESAILGLMFSNLSLIGAGTFSNFTQISIAIEATNLKLAEGGLKVEDYALLTEQSLALTKKLWMDSAVSIGESVENIGSSLSEMNTEWARAAKIGKAIGAAVAFVNAYVAASEALASATFPANIAIAAGVLAKGLAMVAAIKGAAVPGHAKGGAFKVPGGAGGGDKVPFSAMLEPGELVEISSNRSDGYKAGGSRQSSGTRTIYINAGLRQIAEALIPELNAAMRDGHELKLASM